MTICVILMSMMSVTQQEIIDLFNSLIGAPSRSWSSQYNAYLNADLVGEVSKCTRVLGEGSRRFLELTFSSQDAAKYVLRS